MKVSEIEDALEGFDFAELAALRMIVRREVARRWAGWIEEPERLREVAADWDPRLLDAIAGVCEEKAERMEPWRERRDDYQRLADLLSAESFAREMEETP